MWDLEGLETALREGRGHWQAAAKPPSPEHWDRTANQGTNSLVPQKKVLGKSSQEGGMEKEEPSVFLSMVQTDRPSWD